MKSELRTMSNGNTQIASMQCKRRSVSIAENKETLSKLDHELRLEKLERQMLGNTHSTAIVAIDASSGKSYSSCAHLSDESKARNHHNADINMKGSATTDICLFESTSVCNCEKRTAKLTSDLVKIASEFRKMDKRRDELQKEKKKLQMEITKESNI